MKAIVLFLMISTMFSPLFAENSDLNAEKKRVETMTDSLQKRAAYYKTVQDSINIVRTERAKQNSSKSGVKFENKPIRELIKIADSQDKLLLVYCYSKWSEMCGKMDKELFTDHQIGAFCSKHFVCAKFDSESGSGLEVFNKYKITNYPTILIIGKRGKLIAKIGGYIAKERFTDTIESNL